MSLLEHVHIAQRFKRSIKIDSDFGTDESLEGFICPKSSLNVLSSMTNHVANTGQCAFTWTGPYGSGKSSLVVALGSLLNGNKKRREKAAKIIGTKHASDIWEKLPPKKNGWRILPVVGRREKPSEVIGKAIEQFFPEHIQQNWSDNTVVEQLSSIAEKNPRTSGGLIVFIDEMGKFLEGISQENRDIYLFQMLAEHASRSNNRLIVVGVLHQAFEEYANKLSRDIRDEWSKIQGRFVDLPVNTAGEEQVELISNAITTDLVPTTAKASIKLASIVQNHSLSFDGLNTLLTNCWPLHPVVSSLLGPLSKRRFGQNQRSIFGFLNSAEVNGFKDFLKQASKNDVYTIDRLWDYLRDNLEASILSSPEGHRWSLAVESINRCEGVNSDVLQVKLLKAIALLDMLKEQSRLYPTTELLKLCFNDIKPTLVDDAISGLLKWSLIIYRKHANSFAIFAGSDFEIESEVESALREIKEIDFNRLQQLADLQPILAKRHFHETGALRWMDVNLVPLSRLKEHLAKEPASVETIGQFILAIPTQDETVEQTTQVVSQLAKATPENIVIGLSDRNWSIIDIAKQLLALEHVLSNSPKLAGDDVARREVRARLSIVQNSLENELLKTFGDASWYSNKQKGIELNIKGLNLLASEIAKSLYKKSPIIQSELLNRVKLSTNAASARKALLKLMIQNDGLPRLGIEGFPVEGAAFTNTLEKTKLYGKIKGKNHGFLTPKKADSSRLHLLWSATTSYLQSNEGRSVSVDEIYSLWQKPPYGIKDGLLPILAIAYIKSNQSNLAFYREGVFQSKLEDIDTDYLAKDSVSIQLRWMNMDEVSRTLLSGLASVVRELDPKNKLENLSAIDVARGLISIFYKLHPWTQKTMKLSSNAIKIRNIFKHAHDPNKLLFNDIPNLVPGKKTGDMEEVIAIVYDGLTELSNSYPDQLNRLKTLMLDELQVPNESHQAIADLNARAENVKDLSGVLTIESFIMRLATFTGSFEDMESIASLAAGKPTKQWIDLDLDRATVAIADLSQKFNRSEAYARVKGRIDKRHSVAVVVGLSGKPEPYVEEFDISDHQAPKVKEISNLVNELLSKQAEPDNQIVLAALAEVSAEYIRQNVATA